MKLPNRSWLIWFFGLTLAVLSGAFVSASETDVSRPRIGLALGGGSAKGFAHIGILKWFEEHRVPVDYLAGTSMGGLIGGCYAMGMSPVEIEETVRQIDWNQAFSGPPYEVLDYRRKEDKRDYPVDGQIGLKNKKVRLPGGLAAHQVGLIISRVTLPYSALQNFDDLPIPYRCVATDIQNAEAVIMGTGSLSEAMRATMAIPGVFTPVEREGQVLVDGGVLNNVPADVAKSMGAEIVVAVDLNADVQDRDVKGIDAVLTRTISTVVIANSRRSLQNADLVLKPEMGELTAKDWKAVEKFVRLGYEAAEKQSGSLRKYALDPGAWEQYLQRRRSRMVNSALVPQRILVLGAQPFSASMVSERLRRFIGHPIVPAAIESVLTGLTGSGLYESLRYSCEMVEDVPTLVITVEEKRYGPPFADFALVLEADGIRADHVDIAVRSRISSFDIWGEGSEFRVDLGFGTELDLQAELFKPLSDNTSWFWASTVYLKQHNSSLFRDGVRVTDYKSTVGGGGIELGYYFGKTAEVRFGYWVEHQNARVRVGDILDEPTRGLIHRLGLRWTYMGEDDAVLPSRGIGWSSELNWFHDLPGSDEPIGQIESHWRWSMPVGENIVFLHLSGGASSEKNVPLLQQYRLGGPFHLGTYRIEELAGSQYLLMNVGYLKHLGTLPLTGKKLYLGLWLEYGGVFEDWSQMDLEGDLSLGLISPTVFGPVYLGASYGEGENPWFYVGVGRLF